MDETQNQSFVIIINRGHDQLTTRAKLHTVFDHSDLYLRKLPQPQISDRRDVGFVLVAQWNVQQNILIAAHAEFDQLFGQFGRNFEGFGEVSVQNDCMKLFILDFDSLP